MIIIPKALKEYCILVKHFGYENSWEAFANFQYKFKNLF